MRVSCSGCRVLRKGCNESCSIRPCLQWIKNPQAQANATVFLAKFYGRAGLINLIDAGAEHLRPAIFRSLLYEACGRMVNPVYGSAGLLWSGSWHLCQAAVEAVLKGAPIMQIPSETAATVPVPPLHRAPSYDIRHVAKEDADATAAAAHDLRNVHDATRTRVKRPGSHCYDSADRAGVEPAKAKRLRYSVDFHGTTSQVSSGSQASERSSTGGAAVPCDGDSREDETTLSLETVEASMVTSHGCAERGKADWETADDSEVEVELELTLGFKLFHHRHSTPRSSSSSSRRHSRAHSPSCSSSSSAAAKAPKESDRSSVDALEGDMLTTDLKLDLLA